MNLTRLADSVEAFVRLQGEDGTVIGTYFFLLQTRHLKLSSFLHDVKKELKIPQGQTLSVKSLCRGQLVTVCGDSGMQAVFCSLKKTKRTK